MKYDQKQLRDLFLRAKKVLGPQASETLRLKQRRTAFSTAMELQVKAVGGPENVTDEQIFGAFETAHEVFPIEMEALSKGLLKK